MDEEFEDLKARVRILERRMEDLKKWKADIISAKGDEFEEVRQELRKFKHEIKEIVEKKSKE